MTDDTEAARALLEAFGFDRKAGFCLACGFQIEAGLHTPECVVGKLREPLQAALAQARAEGARAGEADGLMKAATRLRDHVGGVLGNRYHPLACEWEAEAAAIRARFPKERQGA